MIERLFHMATNSFPGSVESGCVVWEGSPALIWTCQLLILWYPASISVLPLSDIRHVASQERVLSVVVPQLSPPQIRFLVSSICILARQSFLLIFKIYYCIRLLLCIVLNCLQAALGDSGKSKTETIKANIWYDFQKYQLCSTLNK